MYPSDPFIYKMKKLIAISLCLIWIIPCTCAQHAVTDEHGSGAEHKSGRHRVTAVMAYSFLKNQLDENTDNILVAPTVGLNYDFRVGEKWGLGLHSDIVLQQYKVEDHNDETVLVRENPVALVLVGLFEPLPSLMLIAGYGIELEAHENIQLLRFGVEYGFHLPGNWELGFALEFDRKINTYNSWVFGVGFSKLL